MAVVNDALRSLDAEFDRLYAGEGRPSIPPERLIRACLLQILYLIRSERQIMEQMDHSLLFRWFVSLGIDDAVWVPTVFTMNRDRLLTTYISRRIIRVDHYGLFLAMSGSEPGHHPREDAFLAPALPPAVERLVWPTGFRSVPPAQPVALDEDNSAQHPPAVDPWLAVRLRKERLQTRHLHIAQPEKIAYATAQFAQP